MGERGPYSASSVSPATIVGRANGRSITAFTIDLPGKSPRTRTQAVTVPQTLLLSTTMKAAPKVSLSADTASGFETACQKASAPLLCDSQTRAAIGKTTTTVRKVEMIPTDMAVLARPPARAASRGRTCGALAAEASN